MKSKIVIFYCNFILYLSHIVLQFSSVQELSHVWPMDCSTPDFPVHHQLPKPTQTHGHGVSDAIQPSHPLSSPSSPTLNLSQHQDLFQWVGSSDHIAKVLEFQLQHQSFHEYSGLISFRMDWLDSLLSKGFSRVFSNTQFKSINSSVLSFLYSSTLTSTHDYWKNHSFD